MRPVFVASLLVILSSTTTDHVQLVKSVPTTQFLELAQLRFRNISDGAVSGNNTCPPSATTMQPRRKHHPRRFRLSFFSKYKKHHRNKNRNSDSEQPGQDNGDEVDDNDEDTVGPDDPLEFWIRIGIVVLLLCVAALMSGLTIGLMSLDTNNLAILKRCGTPLQQKYAAAIEPLRKRTHLLLCTLLIGNMLATETLPIILDDLFGGGWKAIVVSTALVVVFGEIIPQAVCSVYALKIGYHASWLVRLLMIIMYPVAGPFSILLTWALGDAEGVIYRRAELKEFVELHGQKQLGELTEDEVTIIKSVLDLKAKQAGEILTPINEVYMLDIDSRLDQNQLEEIIGAGYSRIPIYEATRTNLVGILLVKRLLALNPESAATIRDLQEYCMAEPLFISSDNQLFDILNQFQEGKTHMAAVYDSNHLQKLLGILTLEDVIEEVIGEEIYDESDRSNFASSFSASDDNISFSPSSSSRTLGYSERRLLPRRNKFTKRPATFRRSQYFTVKQPPNRREALARSLSKCNAFPEEDQSIKSIETILEEKSDIACSDTDVEERKPLFSS